MRHIRLAIWNVLIGTPEELCAVAERELLPVFAAQPGFERYDVAITDDGKIVSLSIWDTAQEALAAVAIAHEYVKEHFGARMELVDEHVGNLAWDQGPVGS
jgi:heme-degrading monooxygenase HmoA